MSICTACGAILGKEVKNHSCIPPGEKEVKKPTTTNAMVE